MLKDRLYDMVSKVVAAQVLGVEQKFVHELEREVSAAAEFEEPAEDATGIAVPGESSTGTKKLSRHERGVGERQARNHLLNDIICMG
mmetsp:Transcript_17017/g.29482  ORF Transcript_17017/g.29482 Transcript_17017/m.29482 type:complete len:87 (-) Transcript_17017:811-1071(-)